MNRILIGVAVAGVGTAIALGARSSLLEYGVESAVVEAPEAEVSETLAPENGGGAEGATSGVMGEASASGPDVPSGHVDADAGAVAGRSEVASAEVSSPADAVGAAAADLRAADPAEADAEMPDPEADEILLAASAAYERVRTLRADFVMRTRNPLLRNEVESRGTLYQRRPDRFLMSFTDPEGDVIVSDGTHIWIYYPSTDARQVVRTPAGVGGAAGVDLQAQFLGDPVERFDATLLGRETVQGRSAHVVRMVPREYVGYRELKVWVDGEDWLARRFEITEESGVVRRIELRDLRINGSLSDDLFRFTPPPGARVVDRG